MSMLLLAIGLAVGQPADVDMNRLDRLAVTVHRLENRIESLEQENELLRERVEQLEAALSDWGAKQGDAAQNDPDAQIAQIIRVENTPTGEEKLREAARLESEAAAFEDKAQVLERDAAELQRRTAPRHLRGEARRRWEETERVRVRQERRELRRLAREEGAKARQRIGRANQLRREAEEIRQFIYAWDGDRSLILETQRDFSRQITSVKHSGRFFTWDGSVIETTQEGIRYSVRRISPAVPPDSFDEWAE